MATTKRPSGLEQALIGFFQGVNTGIPAGVQQGRQQEKLEAERLRKEAADEIKRKQEEIKTKQTMLKLFDEGGVARVGSVFGEEEIGQLFPRGFVPISDATAGVAEEPAEVKPDRDFLTAFSPSSNKFITVRATDVEAGGLQGTDFEVVSKAGTTPQFPKEIVPGKLAPPQQRQFTLDVREYYRLLGKKEKISAVDIRGLGGLALFTGKLDSGEQSRLTEFLSVNKGEWTETNELALRTLGDRIERIGGLLMPTRISEIPTASQQTTQKVTQVGEFRVEEVE